MFLAQYEVSASVATAPARPSTRPSREATQSLYPSSAPTAWTGCSTPARSPRPPWCHRLDPQVQGRPQARLQLALRLRQDRTGDQALARVQQPASTTVRSTRPSWRRSATLRSGGPERPFGKLPPRKHPEPARTKDRLGYPRCAVLSAPRTIKCVLLRSK